MGNRNGIAEGLFRANFQVAQITFRSLPTTVSPFTLYYLSNFGFCRFFFRVTNKFYQFHRSSIRIRNNHPRRAHPIYFYFKPSCLLFASDPSLSHFIKVGKAYVQLRSFSMSDVYVFILGRGARLRIKTPLLHR